MPCSGCGADFGIFKKEHGCKNCGFAFCSSCLTKKAIVPKLGSKHSVCNPCYDILNSKRQVSESSSAGRISPPAALQRRLDALQDPKSSKPFTMAPRPGVDQDQVLANRLEKLRQDKRGSVPSEKELEERLAKLKGVRAPSTQAPIKVYYQPPDRRTATEQSSHLLQQMQDEVALDTMLPKPEEEIAGRLARLRGDDQPWNDLNNPGNSLSSTDNTIVPTDGDVTLNSGSRPIVSKPDILQNLPNNIGGASSGNMRNLNEVQRLMEEAQVEAQLDAERAMRSLEADKELKRKLDEIKANQDRSSRSMEENEESEEEEDKLTDKLIEKLLAENQLDESCPDVNVKKEKKELNTPDSDQISDTEELPWCNICTGDATIRCHGCDGELYCHRCFRECHDTVEMEDHKTSHYRPPATKKL